ncbi:hypothetical protein ACFL54_09015 [Planctomycetota bacterium]
MAGKKKTAWKVPETGRVTLYVPNSKRYVVEAVAKLAENDPELGINRTVIDTLWAGLLLRTQLLALYDIMVEAAKKHRKQKTGKMKDNLDAAIKAFNDELGTYGLHYKPDRVISFSESSNKKVRFPEIPPDEDICIGRKKYKPK